MQEVSKPQLTESVWADDRWTRFQKSLRTGVSPTSWHTWLSPLEPRITDGRLTLMAPNDFHLRWVMDKHEDSITHAFHTVYGNDWVLSFASLDSDGDPDPGEIDPTVIDPTIDEVTNIQPSQGLIQSRDPGRVSEKYRFETFVVGQSNQFASAAAMAVAEQPGTNYNPLFIYAGAGLGKTHLLHAIGHHALDLYRRVVVRYVTSETFFSEFIDGIRRKRMDDFKQRYRTTDILLLDDVQFFDGKEQILEEFFHTFNALYECSKQLVITSDRHPRELSTLEDRLRSRFEWGLLTDIHPPDVETRLAILRRNAEYAPHPVPLEVLQFIASLVSDNIRELEGSLTRVTAFAALTGRPISVEMANEVLHDLRYGASRLPNATEIIFTTAADYGFHPEEVTGPNRRRPLVACRQVAMYLCRDLTNLSLPKIGSAFGGRDHTTVIHSVAKVTSLMQTDREVYDRVCRLTQTLRKK